LLRALSRVEAEIGKPSRRRYPAPMTIGKQTARMSTDQLRALLDTERTVTVTLTGPEYAELEMLAQHRGLPVEEFIKALVREDRDATIERARTSPGAGGSGENK
jgi:hypothetical protein